MIDAATRAQLATEARRVLDQNWTGRATRPSPRLYPHQWSWDSAFIAIGNAPDRWDLACAELDALFAAQWSNGMVPHIVFDPAVTGYEPSKEWWGSPSAPSAPAGVWTSGMCQPPVHAMAVARLVAAAPSEEARNAVLDSFIEPLEAWHDYLHRYRVVDHGMAEIWHPWESGMDNSPLWDQALESIELDPDDVPAYTRVDLDHAAADARPTADHYDRYSYLVHRLRVEEYEPADARAMPFRIHDVLFNAVLVRADRVLADLVEQRGGSGDERRRRAQALADALVDHLWDEERGWFLDRNAATGERIEVTAGAGASPLLGPLPPELAQRLIATLRQRVIIEQPSGIILLPTVSVDDPTFEPRRYWRGPAWVNLTWLVAVGLDEHGERELAEQLRDGMVELAAESGMFEYFDATTHDGLGGSDFSWTAALVLDVLQSHHGAD